MRIISLAAALAIGTAIPASALDLSGGKLRGSDESATDADWATLASLEIDVPVAISPDDQLDAMVDEDGGVVLDTAETDAEPRATTVQEAMLELSPPEPVIETIPILHAMPREERVSYHVPRGTTSLQVVGGSWALNNPRGSTVTLGADWAR